MAALRDPDISIEELMQFIPGPDFPTGAQINGRAGIVQAYRTGRGRIYVRAKAEVITDESKGKDTIIIHEIPYQLNKSRLIERIAELVKEKSSRALPSCAMSLIRTVCAWSSSYAGAKWAMWC